MQFPEVLDWTQRPEDGIKDYSGTATYSNAFRLKARSGQRVFLELGDVKDVAEVRVNGKKAGIASTRPYRVEITSVAHADENHLEIDLVNLRPDRMIRDGPLPPATRFTGTSIPTYYGPKPQTLLPSGLLDPVTMLVGS